MNVRMVATGLAWFGIGLGLVEVFAPGRLAEAIGLERRKSLIRAFGVREIASGAVMLMSGAPEKWLWLRVVGDLLDGGLLGAGLLPANRERDRTLIATLAVAPVVLLDVVGAARVAR